MKNKLIIFVIIAASAIQICAQEAGTFYVGTNPLSYTLSFPLQEDIKRMAPILSGNEYGFSLVGGYYFKPQIALEARLSSGRLHKISSVSQLHTGMMVHPFFKNRSKALKQFYTGIYAKVWDYRNRLTHIHFYHLSPYAVMGYRCNKNRWVIDFRLNQTLAIVSWTNIEHTKAGASGFFSPWPNLIKILPTFSCTINYRLGRKKSN